jgi:hypothetical protein
MFKICIAAKAKQRENKQKNQAKENLLTKDKIKRMKPMDFYILRNASIEYGYSIYFFCTFFL